MGDAMIQAIETVYNGYRFRSRLEARWAVFFDMLGVQYEYETEGFDLGDAGWYLPDFWLPHISIWAEVKPEPLAPEAIKKCLLLAEYTTHPCVALVGLPDHITYTIYPGLEGGWNQIVLDHSQYKGRPWYCFGEDITAYGLAPAYEAACLAARQARFEHGEHGTPRVAPPPPPPAARPLIPRWQLMNAAPKPEDK